MQRDIETKGKRADVAFGQKLLNHHVASHHFITPGTRSTSSGGRAQRDCHGKKRKGGVGEVRGRGAKSDEADKKKKNTGRDKQGDMHVRWGELPSPLVLPSVLMFP